jgi:SPX domain protein involved in polyphosphate accumulation
MFVEAYPPRHVNNIYLDTPEMDCYYENIGGVEQRRKVRIRWYGDLFGAIRKPVLEFKIKDGLVGVKETYPFPSFTLDEHFTRAYFQQVIAAGALPQEIKYYLRDLDPVLVNRYYRWYYASVDGCFRVTVDTDMCFYNIRRLSNPFMYHQHDRQNVVIELKYDAQHDPVASRVAHRFPFAVTKSSKYVMGIERVYL